MTEGQCAFYARVSSESQARDNTIASQVTALRERIAADGRIAVGTTSIDKSLIDGESLPSRVLVPLPLAVSLLRSALLAVVSIECSFNWDRWEGQAPFPRRRLRG